MIKVLAIGNSFSQDALYYLHQIAAADGIALKAANLMIGGCDLQRHWENIQNNARDYIYEEDGVSTERYVSIQDALQADDWDHIVTQQASHDSGLADSYHPYIANMAEYLRRQAPKAEILLHKTWAYEIDSQHPQFARYHHNQQEMYRLLSQAYDAAAQKIGARLIPSGDVIQALRKTPPFIYEKGGSSLCRDGFHATVIYGRYALAATWYKTLTGRSLVNNSYVPHTSLAPNAVCDDVILQVVKQAVDAVVPSI